MSGIVVSTLLLFSAVTLAFTAEQSDWSEGPGVQGPVDRFDLSFSSSVNVQWHVPGILSLSDHPAIYAVDDSLDGANSLFPADIDGDGDMDLAGSALSAGAIVWWENVDGYGFTWEKHVVDRAFTGASSVAAADIDGDGDIDILGAAKTLYGGNDVVWWENEDGSGESWTYHLVSGSFAGAHAVCPADVDGDGDLDMVAASIYRDEITWWENLDGQGLEWETRAIAGSFDGAWTVHCGDIDGDGDIDVAAGAFYADDVAWFENADSFGGEWTRHDLDTGFDGAYFVHTFDVDGDGDLDVLGAASLAGKVVWWENTAGGFISHLIDAEINGPVCVHGCDFDGDGDGDVLAASVHSDAVVLYINDGGSWFAVSIDSSFDGAFAVVAADMDGDGDLDAAGAAMNADAVAWWDRNPGSGYLESSILYTRTDPVWGIIDWEAETPPGSVVAFQVRASDDHTSMGEWSAVLTQPGRLSDHLSDGDSYVQYRALLQASRPTEMPNLFRLEISWVSQGIGDHAEAVADGSMLLAFSPNPVTAVPVVRLVLGVETLVAVSIFDISGRLVWQAEDSQMPAGSHQLPTTEFKPGVYLCRATGEGLSAFERFVVVR